MNEDGFLVFQVWGAGSVVAITSHPLAGSWNASKVAGVKYSRLQFLGQSVFDGQEVTW